MKNIVTNIQARLKEAVVKSFGSEHHAVEPAVDPASNPTFGDFQTNIALTLKKQLNQSPRAIAEKIVSNLQLEDFCEPATIAGPGFINIKLTTKLLEDQINKIKADPRVGVPIAAKPRNVVVDMSSPNIAKEMHVGHLRSTIIGESIARTFAFLGHNVLKLNHVGDWGTQFGMLIAELKDKYPQDALAEKQAIDLGDLVTFYKQARKHFDEDPQFQETARSEVVRLQSGDADSLEAWHMLCDQSRQAFQKIYDMLDIENLIERGESFYNPMLHDVVQVLESKGIAVESEGATCVFLDGYFGEDGKPMPVIVKKRDGGFNYTATDLASIRYRVEHDQADELVYVVGGEQFLHFEMMFKVARLAGFLPPHVKVEHVPFGVAQGEDGKKLKSREGETLKLQDLLNEAIVHARADIESRLGEKGRTESEEWKNSVARAVGLGAVKYADLSLNRQTNYVFSYKKMLSLHGNTAPYMMYAYVRVQGISREGGVDLNKIDESAQVTLTDPVERDLAKQLLRFEDALDAVVSEYLPNRICEYLFELSQIFNRFFESCPVLTTPEPQRTSRLILCAMTANTIKQGLNLLGIRTVERM